MPFYSSMAAEHGLDAVVLEALADEIPVEPLRLAVICDRLAAPQPFGEGHFDQRVQIDARERRVDGLLGDGRRNAASRHHSLPLARHPLAG